MPNILDALNMVADSADQQQKKPNPKSSLTPTYVNKNKQDIAKTFQYDPETDYNDKIRKALGFGQ